MYGTQTLTDTFPEFLEFENDVKMYGTQTGSKLEEDDVGLRMM